MTSEPIADGMSLQRSLVKNLQASRLVAIRELLVAIRELIPMDSVARDGGRANAHKGNIRGTKSSSRDRFRRSQVVYAAVWLSNN